MRLARRRRPSSHERLSHYTKFRPQEEMSMENSGKSLTLCDVCCICVQNLNVPTTPCIPFPPVALIRCRQRDDDDGLSRLQLCVVKGVRMRSWCWDASPFTPRCLFGMPEIYADVCRYCVGQQHLLRAL